MSQQEAADECAMCQSEDTTAVVITEKPIEGGLDNISPNQIQYLCKDHYAKVANETDYSIREIPELPPNGAKRRELKEEILMYNPRSDDQWMKWDDDEDLEVKLSELL